MVIAGAGFLRPRRGACRYSRCMWGILACRARGRHRLWGRVWLVVSWWLGGRSGFCGWLSSTLDIVHWRPVHFEHATGRRVERVECVAESFEQRRLVVHIDSALVWRHVYVVRIKRQAKVRNDKWHLRRIVLSVYVVKDAREPWSVPWAAVNVEVLAVAGAPAGPKRRARNSTYDAHGDSAVDGERERHERARRARTKERGDVCHDVVVAARRLNDQLRLAPPAVDERRLPAHAAAD